VNRAYSVLNIKAVDTDRRTISGIATTPETDRVGDIIDPMGAKFADELPLLWQHEHGKPIGIAKFGKPTPEGIPFTAEIHAESEPGPLKELVDMAWQAIKARLVRGVSIGFRAVEYAFLKEGGIHFTKTEIYELSAVTVPANAGATITGIKSLDAAVRQAMGLRDDDSDRPRPASRETPVVKLNPRQEPMTVKTMGEQIAALQNTRASKVAKQAEIAQKSIDAGVTMDANEQADFDALQGEIEAIDAQVKRLEMLEKSQALTARPAVHAAPVAGVVQPAASTDIRVAVAKAKAPGIRFAQHARCMLLGKINNIDPNLFAKNLYGDDQGVMDLVQRSTGMMIQKAAVAAANTLNQSWAGALVGEEGGVAADFVEFLRPQTIVGRMEGRMRRVPFRTPLISQTSGGQGYWTGEGKAKAATRFDFARTHLEPTKVANIAAATKELLRDSSPSADALIRDGLAGALRERMDLDFIDPAITAIANVRPASILNGVAGIPSSGTDADAIRCDVQALFQAFIAGNNAPRNGVWIMSSVTALALSMLQNPLGQAEFPGISMEGGTFFGMPVIVSDYTPADSGGFIVALVNASDIWFADEGGIEIDVSTEASVQLDTAPTNAGVSGAGNDSNTPTTLVSFWQDNLVGFRAERTLTWQRRREDGVAYLTGVNWGACPVTP
jgi:HK97 family phage prohead protease